MAIGKGVQSGGAAGAGMGSMGMPDAGMKELLRRIGFLLMALVVFRIGVHIPIPGIDPVRLDQLFEQNQGTILAMFNMFSGGALENMSIFALGVMPYISASIIIQLMTAVSPQLEQLKKDGEAGRRKISQYTRYLTVGIALVQGWGLSVGMAGQGVAVAGGPAFFFLAVMTLTTGTVFLMWLGEQITERGIGNGMSMLIFAGIVAGIPAAIGMALESARQGELSTIALIVVAVLAAAVVYAVVFVERGQRRITVNYAKRQQGRRMYAAQQSHLPLKINMAGVIPAIFASSILLLPASLGAWTGAGQEGMVAVAMREISLALAPGQPLYLLLFAGLIVFFCYFYTALMFNPREIAENLKRSGAFIPGIRPGEQSAQYIDDVVGRLTLIGSMYMTAVCLMPIWLNATLNVPFYLGGTSLLIVVVVVMDFMSQVNAHMMSSQYEKLLKKANLKNYGSGAR